MNDVSTRSKVISLFKYLSEIARLRSRPVTSIDSYESVLWINDVPSESGCKTSLRGPESDSENEDWLRITKPVLQAPPPLPSELSQLIHSETIRDFNREPEVSQETWAEHDELRAAWNQYFERSWRPWAAARKAIEPHHCVYNLLHSMYQQILRQAELYELVLCVGLLRWETENRNRVRRHLLALPLNITLEEVTGLLEVSSSSDNGDIRLEQDMLEPLERPDGTVQASITNELQELGSLSLLPIHSSRILGTWINNVSSEGAYSDSFLPGKEVLTAPNLDYAPAIILRKRLQYGLIKTYTEIIDQLQQGADIPFTVRKLVEITDDSQDSGLDTESAPVLAIGDDSLLPLPSNDEQKQIVNAINTKRGLLVQGPPGTGKSHTIANLICYLLARGQRILVTSQTPRALRVLKGMLPKEIRELAVSLLGGDQDSLKDLESSVHAITQTRSSWRKDEADRHIEQVTKRIQESSAMEADLLRRTRELREIETYEHRLLNGRYSGTAQRIAEKVTLEQSRFGWFSDTVPVELSSPFDSFTALELLKLLRQFPTERCAELARPIPKPETLPSEQGFIQSVDSERSARAEYNKYDYLTSGSVFQALKSQPDETLDRLRACLLPVAEYGHRMKLYPENWMQRAAREILTGNGEHWATLHKASISQLADVIPIAAQFDHTSVELPQSLGRPSALNMLRAVQNHLDSGGGFGLPLLRPRPIRDAKEVLFKGRVNGERLLARQAVALALGRLHAECRIDELWDAWSPHSSKVTASLKVQADHLFGHCETLGRLLSVMPHISEAERIFSNLKFNPITNWLNIDQISEVLNAIDASTAYRHLIETGSIFKTMEQKLRAQLTVPPTHPVTAKLLNAIETRDEVFYGSVLAEVRTILTDRQQVSRMEEICGLLNGIAPNVLGSMRSTCADTSWDSRAVDFEEAFHWSQANTWIRHFGDSHNEGLLQFDLARAQSDLAQNRVKLVRAMAWKHCLDNLKEQERVHLMAWTENMKRIGKGTGKRAPIYRAAARQNMEKCRGAIPAWIMPLYRVAETVRPGSDSFDVIIVDEASQSGPDALFLTFLCKKLVIVGDEEQISPDDVGIELEQVDALQKQFLKEIHVPDAFGLGGSLFALGSIFFGARVALQEHFRCMPEIIEFSNKLCYANAPLTPLRRFTGKRLQPIVVVHQTNGYQEGRSSTAFNPPEAEALVNTIKDCCAKTEYEGKTFGVISLLGERQSLEIERMLLDSIGPKEMSSRRIVCGNAYSFQGDERDVMFLTMVAAPTEASMSALTTASFKKRFNVAASRARDQMWLFHTPTLNDFRNKECLRYRLLEYCSNPKLPVRGGGREHCTNKFERDVFDLISAKGYRVIPQYEVAGYFIDMVVEGEAKSLAVECDGDAWHTAPEDQERDMRRERILKRCGWTFWRVRGSEFYLHGAESLDSLWKLLDELGIGREGTDLPGH